MKVNATKRISPYTTHEGAPAKRINAEKQLRRSVLACLLWEDGFYEDGESIAFRIASLIPQVDAQIVAEIAITAREDMKLRHVPLFIVREMARHTSHKGLVADTLARIIQRPDELNEFLAMYWKDGRCPISSQVKKGLARAFTKFDEYQLAKYNRDHAIRLRDVLRLCRAKPESEAQELLWKRLINDELETPYTWEVELTKVDAMLSERERAKVQELRADLKTERFNSSRATAIKYDIDEILKPYKHEIWRSLLDSRKLGGLALLRNLRNMQKAGVANEQIIKGLEACNVSRILPYRFITAARFAPQLEPILETMMFRCLKDQEKLPGRTVLLVDVSGSMDEPMADRIVNGKRIPSETWRIDAACGLAVLIREVCEEAVVITFSARAVEVPPRRGFALRDAIINSQDHTNTYLGQALKTVDQGVLYDRLIVITDEQSRDPVGNPRGQKGYMINVASEIHGVGYGRWKHIDGFSEAVIDWIRNYEKETLV